MLLVASSFQADSRSATRFSAKSKQHSTPLNRDCSLSSGIAREDAMALAAPKLKKLLQAAENGIVDAQYRIGRHFHALSLKAASEAVAFLSLHASFSDDWMRLARALIATAMLAFAHQPHSTQHSALHPCLVAAVLFLLGIFQRIFSVGFTGSALIPYAGWRRY